MQGISYALGTFSFDQTQDGFPTTPANLDAGSITIRPNTALTPFGVELAPSGGISSQYTLTLPLPVAQTSFVTQDPSGVLSGSIPTSGGIQQTNMAANSVGTAQIIDLNITTDKYAAQSVTLPKLAPIVNTANSFGPSNIPSTAAQWYTITGNSMTLGPGQWRLTGNVSWATTGNQIDGLRFGWFGANGNNTNTTPTSLTIASRQSGRLGELKGIAIVGTNLLYYFANAPETIITLGAASTVVYLNMAHDSATGTNMQYQGSVYAEQIR